MHSALAWEMERPSDALLNIEERVENNYSGSYNEASVSIGVHVAQYQEDPARARVVLLLLVAAIVETATIMCI